MEVYSRQLIFELEMSEDANPVAFAVFNEIRDWVQKRFISGAIVPVHHVLVKPAFFLYTVSLDGIRFLPDM